MRYFTIKELTDSQTARARGIDNTPDAEHERNLRTLVAAVLDPLREAYGKPIRVTSGYRSPRLNSAVGGVKKSHHSRGMAADIVGTPNTGKENRRLYDLIKELGLPFSQRIHEKGSLMAGPRWVHVSYDPQDRREESLYTLDGKSYHPWPFS